MPGRKRKDIEPGASSIFIGNKKWSSMDGMALRADQLEPGPPSVEALFNWPTTAVAALGASEMRRLKLLFSKELVVYSDYSGPDCYREASELAYLAACRLWSCQHDAAKLIFARASDGAKLPRKVLSMTSEMFDESRSCVFGDLLDRLEPWARDHIFAAAPPRPPPGRLHAGTRNTAYKAVASIAHQSIIDWCSQNRMKIFRSNVECSIHGGVCPVHPSARQPSNESGPDRRATAKEPGSCNSSGSSVGITTSTRSDAGDSIADRPLYVSTCGVACVGWSSRSVGVQRGTAHGSEIPWAVWAAERQCYADKLLEDVAFAEFPPMFPQERRETPQLLTKSIITGPEMMGWPTRRRRLFCALLNQRTVCWVGPSDHVADFEKKYYKMTQLAGDSLLLSSEEELLALYKAMAVAQGNYVDQTVLADMPVKQLLHCILPVFSRQIYDEYEAVRHEFQSLGGKYLCDLHQHPRLAGSQGSEFPSQVTNGLVVSMPDEKAGGGFKIASGFDHLSANGFHVCPAAQTVFPPSKLITIFRSLTEANRKSLSGNGVHLACVGAWLVYILANVVRIDKPVSIRCLPCSDFSDDYDDADS